MKPGKSTLRNPLFVNAKIPFSNADLIAAASGLDAYQAAAQAEQKRHRFVAAGRSFMFESVFSRNYAIGGAPRSTRLKVGPAHRSGSAADFQFTFWCALRAVDKTSSEARGYEPSRVKRGAPLA